VASRTGILGSQTSTTFEDVVCIDVCKTDHIFNIYDSYNDGFESVNYILWYSDVTGSQISGDVGTSASDTIVSDPQWSLSDPISFTVVTILRVICSVHHSVRDYIKYNCSHRIQCFVL
jgi:hypothetical protein